MLESGCKISAWTSLTEIKLHVQRKKSFTCGKKKRALPGLTWARYHECGTTAQWQTSRSCSHLLPVQGPSSPPVDLTGRMLLLVTTMTHWVVPRLSSFLPVH
eukprot:1156224-Pelagomonas_calceolata.AAC.4